MVHTGVGSHAHAVPSGLVASPSDQNPRGRRHLVHFHEWGAFPDASIAERRPSQARLAEADRRKDELPATLVPELHGGTVAVETAGAGPGSTFTVSVPALPSSDTSEASAERPEPVTSRKQGRPRVLIVDDNEDATELLAETLGSAGFETMVAYDGPEALRTVAATPPDVALIDIGLPVMDGYELAARLREQCPASALRLIALTGYGQESDRERSRNVGFDLHLVKPVDLETLLRAIEA